jgi:hypothetical protein
MYSDPMSEYGSNQIYSQGLCCQSEHGDEESGSETLIVLFEAGKLYFRCRYRVKQKLRDISLVVVDQSRPYLIAGALLLVQQFN